MKIIFIAIAIFFVVMILRETGVKKLSWYFVGILFFPAQILILSTPQVSFPRLMIYALFASLIIDNKNDFLSALKKFPLRGALFILIFSFLTIGIMDQRVDLYLRIYRPLNYFLENFFVIFLVFPFIRSVKDFIYIYKVLVVCFLVFSLYGIANLVTGRSEYFQFISSVYNIPDTGNAFMTFGRSRFRIASFTYNPIFYGFLLCMAIYIVTFLINIHKSPKTWYYLGVFAFLVNLILVNSRTPIVALTAGIALFLAFALNLKKKVKTLFLGLSVILVGAFIFPNSMSLIEETINTFSDQGSDLEGSSVQMREMQLAASLVIFNQSPVFGHGFSYIIEGLGFGDQSVRMSDEELQGFESYAYELFIEQGLIGIASNVAFFISLCVFLFTYYRKVDILGKRVILLTGSMLFSFLLFIFGTGDLGTFVFFMSVMGINLKVIIGLSKIQKLRNESTI